MDGSNSEYSGNKRPCPLELYIPAIRWKASLQNVNKPRDSSKANV